MHLCPDAGLRVASPPFAEWLTGLGRFATVAMFDKRGTGMSDPVTNLSGMDERMDDVRAVMDAAGIEKAVVMGLSEERWRLYEMKG